MKNSGITVTDQFCGCGGSSDGVRRVSQKIKGLEVKLALNHWKLAIETHNTNFPNTDHDCTDISACDPRRYNSTDILLTSPECTNHTIAKGQKIVKKQLDMFSSGLLDPAAERSRATMWDVPRFAEVHKYKIIIVENVVDAYNWVMFDAWIYAMDCLGYSHKFVFANSMFFYPTPQSRDRMYVVFWKKGNKAPELNYSPLAYCPKCDKNVNALQRWKNQRKQFGKYNRQYVYCCPECGHTITPFYYASFNCIDWSDLGNRIGDRKRELSENTVKRIEFGLKNCSRPFIVNDQHSTGVNFRVRDIGDRIDTICGTTNLKLISPFLINGEHNKEQSVRSVLSAMQTQTTRQTTGFVFPAFVVNNKGESKSKGIIEPFPTQTTKEHLGVISSVSWQSFIQYYYGNGNTSEITDALGTCTVKDRHGLISYETPNIEDCFYRMLKPKEIKKAMAFYDDYVICGNNKDVVKQCGNAVTPPVMEWIVEQCVNSLM